jgi:hypothetical protein
MTRRELALRIITAEVASTGKAGKCAIRAYVECRMSRESFEKACAIGLAIYERQVATAGVA